MGHFFFARVPPCSDSPSVLYLYLEFFFFYAQRKSLSCKSIIADSVYMLDAMQSVLSVVEPFHALTRREMGEGREVGGETHGTFLLGL